MDTKVWTEAKGCTHVSLCDLHNSTYTGDVDNTGRVAFDISTALVQQTEKCSGHIINRERIDLVNLSPCLGAVIVEQCVSECLGIGIFRSSWIIEES
jgi:hypothetical protein